MAITERDKRALAYVGALLMFIAGFALADIVLFEGEIMPDAIRPFAGWLVCIGFGVFTAGLFWKQNKP